MTIQEQAFVDALVTLMLRHGVKLFWEETFNSDETYCERSHAFGGANIHLNMSDVEEEYERRTRR